MGGGLQRVGERDATTSWQFPQFWCSHTIKVGASRMVSDNVKKGCIPEKGAGGQNTTANATKKTPTPAAPPGKKKDPAGLKDSAKPNKNPCGADGAKCTTHAKNVNAWILWHIFFSAVSLFTTGIVCSRNDSSSLVAGRGSR